MPTILRARKAGGEGPKVADFTPASGNKASALIVGTGMEHASEILQNELAPAGPRAPEALPAGGTGMASALGNSAFSALVGRGARVDVPARPVVGSGHAAIARQLAGDVRRRAAPATELAVSRFKWPWESEDKVAEPAHKGVGEAAKAAADNAAAEKAKRDAADKRAALEKEIAGLEAAESVVVLSVRPTISTARPALASPSANAALVSSQLKGVGPRCRTST
jgi:hypothetical protein